MSGENKKASSFVFTSFGFPISVILLTRCFCLKSFHLLRDFRSSIVIQIYIGGMPFSKFSVFLFFTASAQSYAPESAYFAQKKLKITQLLRYFMKVFSFIFLRLVRKNNNAQKCNYPALLKVFFLHNT